MKKMLIVIVTALCAATMFAKDEIVITKGDFSFMKEKGKKAVVNIDWSKAEIVKYDSKEESIEEIIGSFDKYIELQDDDPLENLVIKPTMQRQHYGEKEWMNIQIKQAQAKMKKNVEPIVLWEPSKEDILAIRMMFYQHVNACDYDYGHKKNMLILMQRDSIEGIATIGRVKQAEQMKVLYESRDVTEYDYVFTIKIDAFDMGSGAASEASGIALGKFKGKIGGAILNGKLVCKDAHTQEIVATADLDRVKGFGTTFDVDRVQSVFITVFEDLLSKSK